MHRLANLALLEFGSALKECIVLEFDGEQIFSVEECPVSIVEECPV